MGELVSDFIAVSFMAVVVNGAVGSDSFDEDRYNALIAEIRCPKCMHVNIAGSDAPIAKDLRKTVRELMIDGKSDEEIRGFLMERYGDFILYDPPLKPQTWLLWFTPLLFLIAGLSMLYRVGYRSSGRELTEEEREEIDRLTR